MDQKLKELSDCRLEKARLNLKIVGTLIQDGYYNFAINRSYYAAFDAMRAVNAFVSDVEKYLSVI